MGATGMKWQNGSEQWPLVTPNSDLVASVDGVLFDQCCSSASMLCMLSA